MNTEGPCQQAEPRADAAGAAAQDLEKRLREENARREAVRTQLTRLQERRDADEARLRAACTLAATVGAPCLLAPLQEARGQAVSLD